MLATALLPVGPTAADYVADLSTPVALVPGQWYALVYGSGRFGATGIGALTENNTDVGFPSLIFTHSSSWNNLSDDGVRFFLTDGVVPTITSLGSASANEGSSLTVNGANFTATSVVQFNGVNAATTFVSSTQLTATVPDEGSYTVTVADPGNGTSNGVPLTSTETPLTVNLDSGSGPGILYGLSSSGPGRLYRIDEATGAATFITGTAINPNTTGLAVLDGQLWASDVFPPFFSTGTIDPTTGAFTLVSNQGGSHNWRALAANRSADVLYTVDIDQSNTLMSMTPAGVITTIGTGTGIQADGLVYDNATGVLYAIGSPFGGPLNLYTIDTTTGVSTLIGPTGINHPGALFDLAFDEATGKFLINDGTNQQLFQLNITTGRATLVGSNGVGDFIDGMAWARGLPMIDEGQSTQAGAVIGTFTDPDNPSGPIDPTQTSAQPEYTAVIDWGDGTPATTVDSFNNPGAFNFSGGVWQVLAPAHAYAEEGSYNITLTVIQPGQPAVGPVQTDSIVVNDAPVVVNAGSGASLPAINETGSTTAGTVIGTFTDPGNPGGAIDPTQTSLQPEYKVVIDWGDSTPTTTVDSFNALGAFNYVGSNVWQVLAPTHTYADNGNYNITLTVTHDALAAVGPTQTDSITVANVAPTASISNNGPVNEGSPVTVNLTGGTDASSVDAASLHHFFSTTQATRDAATYAGSGTATSQNFTFNDNGSYIVYARILDKDGGYTDYQTTVDVNNVAPTATISNSGPVNEGSPVTVSLSSPSDPSSADTAAGFHYSYATTLAGLATTYAGATDGTSKAFTFPDNGTPTVYARIFDKDGGHTDYSTVVTVRNVAPAVAILGSTTGAAGQARTYTGSFTDPGKQADADYTYQWYVNGVAVGGASGSVTTYGTAPGNFTYTPLSSGTYIISLHVTDNDSGEGVSNFITLNVGASTVKGTGLTLSSVQNRVFTGRVGIFTDTNLGTVASQFKVLINWGDGINSVGIVRMIRPGLFEILGTHKYTRIANFTIEVSVTETLNANALLVFFSNMRIGQVGRGFR